MGEVAAAVFEHLDLTALARNLYGRTGVAQARRFPCRLLPAACLTCCCCRCCCCLLLPACRPPPACLARAPQAAPELLLVLCRSRAGFERLMGDAFVRRQLLTAMYASLFIDAPTAGALGLSFWTVAHLWAPDTLVRHW